MVLLERLVLLFYEYSFIVYYLFLIIYFISSLPHSLSPTMPYSNIDNLSQIFFTLSEDLRVVQLTPISSLSPSLD